MTEAGFAGRLLFASPPRLAARSYNLVPQIAQATLRRKKELPAPVKEIYP